MFPWDEYSKLITITIDGEQEDRIKDEIKRMLAEKGGYYLRTLRVCESPIEKLLMLRLMQEQEYFEQTYGSCGIEVDIIPQMKVEVDDKNYRVDFVLTVVDVIAQKRTDIAIECDGHDFHEKTKEQAAKDKMRDRDLQKKGMYVIRFTGSEIWKSPTDCASEVFDIAKSLIKIHEVYERRYPELKNYRIDT